jgi:uncharacterized glyoxalase superfamily protein PhnB
MPQNVVPMIHVPDVRATAAWYQSIGFTVVAEHEDDFAMLRFGDGAVMFTEGGQPSDAFRREVDLYVYVDEVDALFEQLKDRVDVIEGLHDTFYGTREIIIRDCNRFWITFGRQLEG